MEHLALPFALSDGYLDKAELYDSISYSIGLLLSSRRGSLPFDPDYGCDVWEKEFSDLYTANKADLRANIRNAIDKYEKRLYNVSVSLSSIDTTPSHALGLAVKVSGNYRDNGEEKKYEQSFRIG
ncbi:MAG: GPW/gp25 family protein [Candidatus Zixiibacteriota bacterium]|nr:MAG: GPW/gp25 family protein [candidate division Zixibacteria bacterium]